MAKDELTYSEAVRAAAAAAAAALGTNPEVVRQRASRVRREPGKHGKARLRRCQPLVKAEITIQI